MTTNRGQDDELVDLELVDLEPERREQETEERPVMPQNGGQDDELVDLELVDLEPERREQETEERPVSGDAQERRPSRRARRSERRSGQWSGRSGEERTVEWPLAGVERERQRNGAAAGGCDAAQAQPRREREGVREGGREQMR
jgi:hypothetical protein